jgi:chromosome partitioning protein
MAQKHLVFFNTKGGVCKSTLCEYSRRELTRLGYEVSVDNVDQQVHVKTIVNDNAEFCLYDTAGAFTGHNLDLLKAASGDDIDAVIIVPYGTGENDKKEYEFVFNKLNQLGLLNKSKVVFTKTRKNSKYLTMRRDQLNDLGIEYIKWVLPDLEDFKQSLDSSRTRNEISAFLHEVIL